MKVLSPEQVSAAWIQACEFWGATLDIAKPADSSAQENATPDDAIAYIKMDTRQVVYSSKWFIGKKVEGSLPAAFAHELAHHMRYPQSLRVSAQLVLLGNQLVPGLQWSAINLFLDLLVNEHVGRDPELRRQLIRLYKAIADDGVDEMYSAYLCVYESLWFGEADFSLKLTQQQRMVIRKFTDNFYQLLNVYEQFLYFLCFFVRYFDLPVELQLGGIDPLTGDAPAPDVEDFPVDGAWTREMKDAYERATKEKWDGSTRKAAKAPSGDNFRGLADAVRSLPGKGQPDAPRRVALRYYQALIEREISAMPLKLKGEREPFAIPAALEEWEFDGDPKSIDWLGSVQRGAELAAAFPLMREQLVEPGPQGDLESEVPDFEIYLDTSGSMPDPVREVNAMTLAALVLSTYTVRKGGRVRGVIYSSGTPIVSDGWMLEERDVQSFFLSYIGGGTTFPLDQLEVNENRRNLYRVIISDSDFVWNVSSDLATHIKALEVAANGSKALVMLLHHVTRGQLITAKFQPLLNHPNVRFVPVAAANQFAAVAASLALALLGEL